MPAAAGIPAPIAYINVVVVPSADVAHLCSTCSTDSGEAVAHVLRNLTTSLVVKVLRRLFFSI